jgi:hypothetical protein
MRKEYQILLVRLVLIATFTCAVATRSTWFVPSCYATTSEAQQEADLKVSLPAEKIIEILRPVLDHHNAFKLQEIGTVPLSSNRELMS